MSAEFTQSDVWQKLLTDVKNSLDMARDQTLAAAEREPVERVRYLAGQYAGIALVYQHLRRL